MRQIEDFQRAAHRSPASGGESLESVRQNTQHESSSYRLRGALGLRVSESFELPHLLGVRGETIRADHTCPARSSFRGRCHEGRMESQSARQEILCAFAFKPATRNRVTVRETAAQWDLRQPAVRSMKWVVDFSRFKSTTWRWWPNCAVNPSATGAVGQRSSTRRLRRGVRLVGSPRHHIIEVGFIHARKSSTRPMARFEDTGARRWLPCIRRITASD